MFIDTTHYHVSYTTQDGIQLNPYSSSLSSSFIFLSYLLQFRLFREIKLRELYFYKEKCYDSFIYPHSLCSFHNMDPFDHILHISDFCGSSPSGVHIYDI